MLYEELRGRSDKTPLQERLCFFVYLKHQQQRFAEMKIVALAGMTQENSKQLQASLDQYQDLLIPGVGKPQDEFLEKAKKQLAEAAKEVFLVKPKYGAARGDAMRQAATSSNDALRTWAREEMDKERKMSRSTRQRLLNRRGGSQKPLPEGTVTEDR